MMSGRPASASSSPTTNEGPRIVGARVHSRHGRQSCRHKDPFLYCRLARICRLSHMENSESRPDSEVLSVHECWRYLRSASVARVGVVSGDSAEIFPVNFLPDEGTVIFRTGPGTKLDAVLAGKTITLEADRFQHLWHHRLERHRQRSCRDRHEGRRSQESAAMELSPWEPGTKDHLVRVTPAELSGRRFVINAPSE